MFEDLSFMPDLERYFLGICIAYGVGTFLMCDRQDKESATHMRANEKKASTTFGPTEFEYVSIGLSIQIESLKYKLSAGKMRINHYLQSQNWNE